MTRINVEYTTPRFRCHAAFLIIGFIAVDAFSLLFNGVVEPIWFYALDALMLLVFTIKAYLYDIEYVYRIREIYLSISKWFKIPFIYKKLIVMVSLVISLLIHVILCGLILNFICYEPLSNFEYGVLYVGLIYCVYMLGNLPFVLLVAFNIRLLSETME